MRHPLWVRVASVAVGLASLGDLASSVHAEEPTDQAVILKRLDELDQEVRILKRKLELSQEDTTTNVKEGPVVTASRKDGFSLQSAEKSYQLKIRGYVQADGRFFIDDEPGASTFTMRRVQPIIDGSDTPWACSTGPPAARTSTMIPQMIKNSRHGSSRSPSSRRTALLSKGSGSASPRRWAITRARCRPTGRQRSRRSSAIAPTSWQMAAGSGLSRGGLTIGDPWACSGSLPSRLRAISRHAEEWRT